MDQRTFCPVTYRPMTYIVVGQYVALDRLGLEDTLCPWGHIGRGRKGDIMSRNNIPPEPSNHI